ncbi:MAG: outer membrane beta-barrel protein [Bacteroidales bacterium]|nr:outer membrane beta-barrel protein [Bacteroidales bacterium]
MTDSRFDRIIREKLEGYQIEVGDGLWSDIEKRMVVAHRRKVAFRVSAISLAAAACLAVGLVLAVDKGEKQPSLPAVVAVAPAEPQTTVEEVVAPVEETPVLPIEEQIKSISVSGKEILATSVSQPSAESEPAAPVVPVAPAVLETITETEQTPVVTVTPAPDTRSYEYERPDIRDLGTVEQIESDSPARGFTVGILASALPNFGANDATSSAPMFAANLADRSSNNISIEQISKSQYSMPIVFGINGVVDLTENFSLGLGLNYSYLETSFDAYVNKVGYRRTSMQLHYLGVSLDAYYRFLRYGPFTVYAKAGGAVDKGLKQRYVYGSQELKENGIQGVQLSVNAGVGAEWRPVSVFGLYVEPTANYFFNTNQPISLHTNQPFSFGLAAGFRFYVNRPF